MADDKRGNNSRKGMIFWPPNWRPFGRRPRTQPVEGQIAGEHDTVLPGKVVTRATGSAAMSFAVNGVGKSSIEDDAAPPKPARLGQGNPVQETTKDTTDNINVFPGPAGAAAGAVDPAIDTVRGQGDQRLPHLEGGVTEPLPVETEASAGGSSAENQQPNLNPGQLQQDIRQAFRGNKAAILTWVGVAQDMTAALQKTLDNAGINYPETIAKAREFLSYQKTALENIHELVEAGATDDAARTLQEWLARAAQTCLEIMSEGGLIRGIVAGAVLCTLGHFGAFAPGSAMIIAAAITRLDKVTLEMLAKLGGK